MPHLAMAISLFLMRSRLLLVSIASQSSVVTAKRCFDVSTNDDGSSFCGSQDSNSFTHSPSRNDGDGDNGEVIPFKHTMKYFNHWSHDGDSENDAPFTLPFP